MKTLSKKFEGKVIGKTTEPGFFWTSYMLAVKLDDFSKPMTIPLDFATYCQAQIDGVIYVTLYSDDGGKMWRNYM